MDKAQTSRHETADNDLVERSKTPAARLRRSCVRFWWLYLLAFAIIVLVIVIPIIYVGYPKLAQATVNRAQLTIDSYRIQNPAPDAFDLEIDFTQSSNSKKHPKLDAFNASLYLPGSHTSFASFEVPAVESGEATKVHIQQRVSLDSPEEFTRYCITTFDSENYSYSVRGKGGLKLGGLPRTTVNYDQDVQLAGLNALEGLFISEFKLLKEPGLFNSNSQGALMVPNPSVVTLNAGNVTATMSVGDVVIGNITLPDLSLQPGNGSYPFYSTTNQTEVALLLQQPQYRCGELPLEIDAGASTFNGQVIGYLTAALKSSTLKVDLNVAPALQEAGFGFILGDSCRE